ncbi:hypothetical protein pipiens_017626 [Culex pipiens pipiens]|uniref:Large ribosomal subunit protein mL37 n=1 Tax=Culex pipiens pipiens TaxID=38569 RepID=A0ABD1CFP1_CULPP
MRLTSVVLRQHIGFHFKRHWIVQGKRVPSETGATAELAARGIPVVDPNALIRERRELGPRVEVVGQLPPEVKFDETHPLYKREPCYVYGDRNVLLEGVRQAQVLVNTVVYDELPLKVEERLEKTKIPTALDRSMQQSVLAALVFDAEQVKTAVVKDPERPAYKLPRNYGISDERRNRLLLSKLLLHCERFTGPSVASSRKILSNVRFVVPLAKDLDRCRVPAPGPTPAGSVPLRETVTIPTSNHYEWQTQYPIRRADYRFANPHTILVHCSPADVANQFETPVTDDQREGRLMLKAFAVAASRARQLYGDSVKLLPRPITVQAVQTDSKWFHFGIYQLNTLDLEADGDGQNQPARNLWFRKPRMDLYGECGYLVGKPALHEYNREVLRHLAVFYGSS